MNLGTQMGDEGKLGVRDAVSWMRLLGDDRDLFIG